jgi:phosphoribosylformylglycinamidine synthase
MAGSRLPIAVAHGEGFANFKHRGNSAQAIGAMRFVDNQGQATEQYPFNPNGSAGGLTAVTTGRALHGHDAAPRARVPQCADELDEW